MSSLRKIRDRIKSVTATRQMTSSMKLIAVSRLKKKHASFLQTVPFADEMNRVIRRLVRSLRQKQKTSDKTDIRLTLPKLLEGNGKDERYVVVMITSDEGLSGASQIQVANHTRKLVDYLLKEGKNIHVFAYGTRGTTLLQRFYPDLPIISIKQKKTTDMTAYLNAERITATIIESFHKDRFDVCLFVYNRFKSVVSQVPTVEQLIPNKIFLKENPWDFLNTQPDEDYRRANAAGQKKIALKKSSFLSAIGGADALPSLQGTIFKTDIDTGKRSPDSYDYEPSDTTLLEAVLPQYLTAYVYRVLLEASVSDNAARLMAMDNATHNAGDMLTRLDRTYRRTRQTRITTDIAEVFTGATQESAL